MMIINKNLNRLTLNNQHKPNLHKNQIKKRKIIPNYANNKKNKRILKLLKRWSKLNKIMISNLGIIRLIRYINMRTLIKQKILSNN